MNDREFHIGDIFSVMDGRLVSPRHIEGVYNLCDYMTGESNFTHQLPRVAEECQPSLRAQFPDLAEATWPEDFPDAYSVWTWLAEQVTKYGETRIVQPLDPADHTSIDPIAEMRMMRPDMEIIVIQGTPDAADEASR